MTLGSIPVTQLMLCPQIWPRSRGLISTPGLCTHCHMAQLLSQEVLTIWADLERVTPG